VSTSPPTAGRRPILLLEDVGKVYASGSLEVEALRGIHLQVAAGDYLAVMGPSGSGKSTLMHILGCLDSSRRTGPSSSGCP